MIRDAIKVRVRYGETDRMGYAHHSVYALYIEEGRTELLRKYGMDYKTIEDHGYIMPLSDMEIQFKRPAFYDEVLTVVTQIKEKPGVKIDFHYEILSGDNQPICTAHTRLVFAKKDTGKPCRPYPGFMKLVDKHF